MKKIHLPVVKLLAVTTDLFVTFWYINALILLEIICLVASNETCQLLEFTLNWLQAQSRVSPVVGLLTLASGQVYLGMAFPPFLIKQLYCCDLVIMASFVEMVYHGKVKMTVR